MLKTTSTLLFSAALFSTTAHAVIRVLDHFIIGDGDALSFAERGWL